MPPRARDADSVTAVEAIARIEHREAMELTAVENERFLSLLQTLVPPDWSRPTDCTRWDVRAVVAHVLGSACAQASPREFVHQLWSGLSLTRRIGGHHWVDGVNEAQVLARRSMSPSELVAEWQVASRRALRARRRLPAPVRSLRVLETPDQVVQAIWQSATAATASSTPRSRGPCRHRGDRHPAVKGVR